MMSAENQTAQRPAPCDFSIGCDSDPLAKLRADDLLVTNAAVVRARCEGQRERLKAAIAQCPDYFARNSCRQYLARVEAVLKQPALGIASFDGATGPNGWEPGLTDAIRSALWHGMSLREAAE